MKDGKEIIFSAIVSIAILSLLIAGGIFFIGPSGDAAMDVRSSVGIYPPVNVLRDNFCCNTTDFDNLTTQELFHVENLTLELLECGKIIWPGPINLILDEDNLTIDLDGAVNLSINLAGVNSSKATSLNTTANVMLCELPFTDPYVLRDGEPCPSDICTLTSYTNPGGNQGVAYFNVTHWTNYTLVEGAPPTPPSGGGGGGRREPLLEEPLPTPKPGVRVRPTRIEVDLDQGETKKVELEIKNTGDTTLELDISVEKVQHFISPLKPLELLAPGQSVTLIVPVTAAADDPVGAYNGWLHLSSPGLNVRIPVLIEVREREAAVTLDSMLPRADYVSGEDVEATLLIGYDGEEPIDTILSYALESIDGNRVASAKGNLILTGNVTLERSLPLIDAPQGHYVFYAELEFDGKKAVSSNYFAVSAPAVEAPGVPPRTCPLNPLIIWLLLIILLLMLILLVLLFPRSRLHHHHTTARHR